MKSFASATWNVALSRSNRRKLGASLHLQFTTRRRRLLPSFALVVCLLLESAGQAFGSFDSHGTSPDRDLLLTRRSTAAFSQWSPAKLRVGVSSRKTGSTLVAPPKTPSVLLRSRRFLSDEDHRRYLFNDVSLGFGRSPPSL